MITVRYHDLFLGHMGVRSDINSCRGSIADSSEVDTTGLEIMADVGADAGSMGVERTLSSATDASPPYFTAPKSVASSARK